MNHCDSTGMDSESEEVVVVDSDESLLDIKELNDAEFDLPSVVLPSLESILWDMESEEGSDSTSLHSFQSLTLKFKSMLHHCKLQGISAQITSAEERVDAGLPTVITNSQKLLGIGTSHGYVFAFDSEQKLCWCCHDDVSNDQGAVSALAFNMDSSRLLVGFERGYVLMLDAFTGDPLRRLPDAHAPQTAVLQLRFTASNNLALVGDSSGCVFSLSFSRRLGVRSWESKCLFSGARGEVCCFEPLIYGHEQVGQHVLVAMATLSKVIIISIKPRLRVLYSQQLPRVPTSLPLLSWQLVLVGKTLQPVLAWGRGSELSYTRAVMTGLNRNKLKLSPLRTVQLPYTMIAVHWIGNRHLAILDTSENLRLIEVRTQKELELLELTSAGLVYSSAHFKALAVGGGVSEAFALAGDRACYNSLTSRGDQLLVLGTKAVHLVKLRTWQERLAYLSDQGRWAEALNLAADEGINKEKSASILLEKYLNSLGKHSMDRENLTAAINCCVKLNKTDILCNDLWEVISTDQYYQDLFYMLLTEHICSGSLNFLSPSVTQGLVTYLEGRDLQSLKTVLLSLDLSCLDLHQVLNICKKRKMYESWIYITTKTIGDYTSPLTEFFDELAVNNNALGNTLLVYVSACLAGLGYPQGSISPNDVIRVKYDVLRCLEAVHSIDAKVNEQSYPYLRALLKFNIRECLNVIKLAFTENEFMGEMGLLQRQRLIEILIQIVTPPEFDETQVTILACFIAKLVTSNNLTIEDSTMESVVKSLTNSSGKPLSVRDHSEREQAWLDLLNANKLTHLDNEELLTIAIDSKCFKVTQYLYEVQEHYGRILTCYLNDPMRKSDVFSYILTHINIKQRCIPEQFVLHFKDLVSIDAKKCVDIVIEHYPNMLETFFTSVEDDEETLYSFLKELVFCDLNIPALIAERYLELLCVRGCDVRAYLTMAICRVEQALEITKRHEVHAATALLLEQMGEFQSALQLLLENNLVEDAIEVCVRGADHLDADSSQNLWLTLLKHPRSCARVSLRHLLHSAAPHVPPAQLLELVADASFGDIKVILRGMLTDCKHDVQVLSTTLRLLGRDLHQGLAKSLCTRGRGLSVTRPVCSLCQSFLLRGHHNKLEDQTALVCSCGHSFHSGCVTEENVCPYCRNEVTCLEYHSFKKRSKEQPHASYPRPNLEGHF